MKKRLFYTVTSWYSLRDRTTYIRHLYGTADSETMFRGLAMEWLDANAPFYKDGSKFSLSVEEIPADTIRECVG